MGDWEKLPAATYSIGFAKNFASAVGLDRNEIGEQLRAEMGGARQTFASPEVYEAADPARTMPYDDIPRKCTPTFGYFLPSTVSVAGISTSVLWKSAISASHSSVSKSMNSVRSTLGS